MTKPYVSIDIETTGLDWNTCQTIEIGAVIDDGYDPTVQHRALDDAWDVIRLIRWRRDNG